MFGFSGLENRVSSVTRHFLGCEEGNLQKRVNLLYTLCESQVQFVICDKLKAEDHNTNLSFATGFSRME